MSLRIPYLVSTLFLVLCTDVLADEYTFLDRLKQYPSTRESRLVAADNFLHDIQAMDDSVPALRPDIMDWVISELDRLTRKHGRLGGFAHPEAIEFRSTREYLLYAVKKGLAEQKEAIRCIKNRPDLELTCWTQLGRSLGGPFETELAKLVAEHGVQLADKRRKYSSPVWQVFLVMDGLAYSIESSSED